MTRHLVAGVLAVLVAAVAIWFLFLRGRGAKDDAAPPGSAIATPEPGRGATSAPAPAEQAPAAPRGAVPQWSLDPDPEGPLQLDGQVLRPDGKGAGGAEVWLSTVPPRRVTAEDDGTFTFDKVVGRTYQVTAKQGDLVGGPVTYKLTASSDPLVIRLLEGVTVIASVTDDAKQPIEGAVVRAGESGEAKTDAKGEATLRPVRPGWIAVAASAEGYAPGSAFTTIGSPGGTGRVAIVLRKGYRVAGRVIDEAGKPIPRVKVFIAGEAWGLDDDARDRATATTDAKGQFAIAAVAPGTFKLSAVDGEHAPGISTPVTVSDRDVTGIEITLAAGGVIAGVVVDGAGAGVPFATVRVSGGGSRGGWVSPSSARQVSADKDGAFEVRGLARGKLQVRAESETAASKITDVELTDKPEVRDLRLVLDVTGTIAGKVIDELGRPVAEVQVNAFPDLMSGASTEGFVLAGMSTATSDGDGRFTIRGLPDGAYRLWASRANAGQFEWGQHGTAAKTGDADVVITLAAPGAIKGRIAIEGVSTPPALAHVQIGYQPATPAIDGAFELKELTPGSHDLTFRGPEFAERVMRDVKVEPGKTTDLGTVTVVRGRRVTGRVVDGKGRAVAGARVKLGDMLVSLGENDDQLAGFEDMQGVRSATSDQDGAFTVIGVSAKPTHAMADHPTAGRSTATPLPGGAEDPPPITLTLRGFGAVSGVVTQKGQPVPGVTISAATKGAGAQATFAQTDKDGAFRIAKLGEGPQVIQAMQSGGMGTSLKTTTVNVNVVAGQEAKVAIDIPVGEITLTVEIRPMAGQQVDGAQTFVYAGQVAIANGKQLSESFFQGGAQGMKIWFGPGKPMPEFTELVPGEYSLCTIPITGDFMDPRFQARLQENMEALRVYCKVTKLPPAPLKQTVVQEVPAMTPLPAPPP